MAKAVKGTGKRRKGAKKKDVAEEQVFTEPQEEPQPGNEAPTGTVAEEKPVDVEAEDQT